MPKKKVHRETNLLYIYKQQGEIEMILWKIEFTLQYVHLHDYLQIIIPMLLPPAPTTAGNPYLKAIMYRYAGMQNSIICCPPY